jgi:hypothetical protein
MFLEQRRTVGRAQGGSHNEVFSQAALLNPHLNPE